MINFFFGFVVFCGCFFLTVGSFGLGREAAKPKPNKLEFAALLMLCGVICLIIPFIYYATN